MIGRLIINHIGETVKVLNRAPGVGATLQVSALAMAVTEVGPMTVTEIAFNKQEIAALCLQLADSIGMACELTKLKAPETRRHDRYVINSTKDGAEYVLKSITPKDA